MRLICLLVVACCFAASALATDKVVCYYVSSNAYSVAKPEDLDANLCTHLNYAFINVQEDGKLKVHDKNLDIDKELYKRVNQMKKINENLKILLSVGGVTAKIFSGIAANATKRSTFVESARYFLDTYEFDGLDLDWEIPRAADKENFLALLNELRVDFDKDGWLLTAAVSAIPSAGYNVPELNKILDIINVMCYDFYGPWSKYTGQNSALYQASIESNYEKKYLNVASAAKNWAKAGADRQKLSIGLPFYGRAFRLKDRDDRDLHAPILGPGEKKTPSFFQICKNYDAWTTIWDDEQKSPIKYSGDQWLGYDNEKSITLKAEHIVSNNYGGIMVWHIGADDIHGACGPKQALLKIINEAIVKHGKQNTSDSSEKQLMESNKTMT